MQRRIGVAIAWVFLSAILSLGVAGIASGLEHLPATGARPELTYGADMAMRPGLDAATEDLRAISDQVDALGATGRSAIAALIAGDVEALAAAVSAGQDQIDTIEASVAALRARLANLPGAGQGIAERVGAETLARYDAIVEALPIVAGLRDDWTRLAAGSIPAIQLTTHLTEHDRIAGEAVRQGAAGRYAAATKLLAGAERELATAGTIRDALAATVDVSTLNVWIERNEAYDAAVKDLWAALTKSKGITTTAVRKALAAEQAARKALPPDTRALVVILGDVARGGLNQAVIAVEEARGRLDAALQDQVAAGQPTPSPAP